MPLNIEWKNHTETKINIMCVLVAQTQHDRQLLEGNAEREGVTTTAHGH